MKAEDSSPKRKLAHLDERGAVHMVDVSQKPATERVAVAECWVAMRPETIASLRKTALAKGDALATARIAAIMAAKRTSDLIPLCHPLPLSGVSTTFEVRDDGVRVEVEVKVRGRTGVEMEAMTAAAVAGLTLIDMVKGVEKGVSLDRVRLLSKLGGRSGTWKRD